MLVPSYADVILDTPQILHFEWNHSKENPDGKRIVKFTKSNENEIMDEETLREAVLGDPAFHLAKAVAPSQGSFVSIPVEDLSSPRGLAVHSDIGFFSMTTRNTLRASLLLLPLQYGLLDHHTWLWLLHQKQMKVKEIHLH